MSDERLKEIIAMGEQAKAWLNHPVYSKVRTVLKAQLIDQFEKSNFNQKQMREEIWADLRALRRVESAFERIIRDADQAVKKAEK